MMNNNPYQLYKEQDLNTVSKQELVGRLFGSASLCLKKSALLINENRLDRANEYSQKAQEIILTLDHSLDMQYGISLQLHSLYVYIINRIVKANVEKNTDILFEVSDILTDLRGTWDEAVKKYKMLGSAGAV
jgi:flagellar protein FliS